MKKKKLGELGENLALAYLQQKGLQLIARNFHSRYGEVDLIIKDKGELVLVEVKTRTSDQFGRPEEAVNQHKLQKIIKAGQFFCLKHPHLSPVARVDIVSIVLDPYTSKVQSLEHIKNLEFRV